MLNEVGTIEFIFHGGVREVGRSCIEVASKDTRLLLDCGLKLTQHQSEYPVGLENIPEIDAVFISHAHLDHTGALPLLEHKGLNCSVFATKGTKNLTRLLLKDAFKIGVLTHQHLGYSSADIKDVLTCMKRVVVNTKGTVKNISYEYFDAGHIPGSALVLIELDGKRILYTGDMNTVDTCLLKGAEINFKDIDVLICESTYGNREHPPRSRVENKFISTINAVISKGGSVIIPVFAVGRAQEILLLLLRNNFNVPIYFDGMAVKATDIILSNEPDVSNANELRTDYKKVNLIKRFSDRLKATSRQGIFLTTSGMLTGGPVITYLKYLHKNPSDAVLLTGYQVEDTNGRLLINEKQVYLDGRRTNVKCFVDQFDFSAHVGLEEIKALVRTIRPKKVFFVHGEEESINTLTEWALALGIDAYGPKLGDKINL